MQERTRSQMLEDLVANLQNHAETGQIPKPYRYSNLWSCQKIEILAILLIYGYRREVIQKYFSIYEDEGLGDPLDT